MTKATAHQKQKTKIRPKAEWNTQSKIGTYSNRCVVVLGWRQFWDPSMGRFLKQFSARRGTCFLTCFSLSFSCAGALKFVLFALGAKRAPKQIHWKSQWMFMIFPSLLGRRGRREEGRRGSKSEPKQHTKTPKNKIKN